MTVARITPLIPRHHRSSTISIISLLADMVVRIPIWRMVAMADSMLRRRISTVGDIISPDMEGRRRAMEGSMGMVSTRLIIISRGMDKGMEVMDMDRAMVVDMGTKCFCDVMR
jgi:hypothetical protein